MDNLNNKFKEAYEKISYHVKEKLKGEKSGHDWLHVQRVIKNSLRIAEKEGGDREILRFASLLHDVEIGLEHEKGVDHATESAESARKILVRYGLPKKFIDKVVYAIRVHRYGKKIVPKTLEAKILQDADRLDSIGAIGIARAFAYAGSRGAPLYDFNEEVSEYDPFNVKSVVTHFHEKLLKVKDSLHTDAAKSIAEERHRFMVKFIERLMKEISGEA